MDKGIKNRLDKLAAFADDDGAVAFAVPLEDGGYKVTFDDGRPMETRSRGELDGLEDVGHLIIIEAATMDRMDPLSFALDSLQADDPMGENLRAMAEELDANAPDWEPEQEVDAPLTAGSWEDVFEPDAVGENLYPAGEIEQEPQEAPEPKEPERKGVWPKW